jgi:superfamily I DNA and/or RNA helicase/transcription elongation GreA/GreB family factor/very-short-patch-repair endonuclease
MEITEKLLIELQNRLKVGSRRGVHLNAIPARSRYKFDLTRLSHIDKDLPKKFINSLLTEQPLKFKISWKDNVPDLNSLFEDDQAQLVKITKSFENLINQTAAIESEKGINTFGFGFPLLVRRDQSDKKLTVAPILVWSLRIKRSKEFNTWVIHRDEDDPIYVNEVLINHLQNDSKIELEQLSSDLLDDGLIDKDELLDICVRIIETINSTTPDDLRETFKEKLENVKSISDKKHYEKLPLTSNNSFIEFGGLFSIFEVQKQNIIHDYGNMLDLEGATIDLEDMEEHTFQPISSVETDPSQQGILHSLENTRNILIQGPPGTGKSQSLTAILVNALENKKKTIVVCEKRTALEVLHNSLNEKGLNYQCVLIKDIVKDRRAVVNSVRDRIDNSSYRRYRYTHSKENLDGIIDKAKSLIDSINKKHIKLGENLVGSKNWTRIVGELLAELKGNNEDYDLEIEKGIFKYESNELNGFLELIRKGQLLYNEYKPNKDLSFLNPDKLVSDNLYSVEEDINEAFERYQNSYDAIILLYKNYFKEFNQIFISEKEEFTKTLIEDFQPIQKTIEEAEKFPDFYDNLKTSSSLFKLTSLFITSRRKTLRLIKNFNYEFQPFVHKYPQLLANESDLESKSIKNKIDLLNNFLKKIRLEYAERESAAKDYFKVVLNEKLDFTQTENPSLKVQQEIGIYSTKTLKTLIKYTNGFSNTLYADNLVKYKIIWKTIMELAFNAKELIAKKNKYFENEEDLFSAEFKWFQFYNSISELEKTIIDQLLEKTNWKKVFLLHYLNSMLVNSANTDLPTNDNDHKELSNSLSKLEQEQLKYIKEYWYSKQIDATRDFDNEHHNLAAENLYNKKAGTKHKRLSLRQIVEFDIDLFTTFFPIILTTPDVCSNLFKGKNKYFDIVMFDEASQLKLEDNLPALLKGKQVIIAGDEHQMPPSNYFSKIFDGSIDDEDEFEDESGEKIFENGLLSAESLLEFAEELNFEKKHLDFHYRSRHPYLIDFSNYAFYNQRLKPLPNSFDYTPIKYIRVNGTYSDHSNDVEVETVLSIIENNIHRLPNGEYPSVGVATFNIHQRNLILGKINDRRKFPQFEDFNEKMLELEEGGFFVKNLENIQGDERDVIILSTTYGYNKDQKFAQRFGSINHQKGYKLLNVIITRAKYKVYVCSSIPEEVFLNYKEHLSVEGSNNRRAVFFAYLAYSKAVSENDTEQRLSILNTLAENTTQSSSIDILNADLESPFEEEVYQALTDHFEENNIIPQLQFAGFRIDLVYDSKISGIPKIAIECDGAAYHSSQEAYLYDKHRQKILEGHGFVFHRIWSTNWWRNPKREINKLVKFIKSIENSSPSIFEDKSKTGLAFTDDIKVENIVVQKNTSETQKEVNETIEAISEQEEEEEQTELFKDAVKIGSKVKVKYLNNGKNIKVQIVAKEINKSEKANGVQKVNNKSPLAIALIGKSVGETAKVGNLDNYVEVLEIIN